LYFFSKLNTGNSRLCHCVMKNPNIVKSNYRDTCRSDTISS